MCIISALLACELASSFGLSRHGYPRPIQHPNRLDSFLSNHNYQPLAATQHISNNNNNNKLQLQANDVDECLVDQVKWASWCVKNIANGMAELHKWSYGSRFSLFGEPCIGRTVGRFNKRFQLTWEGFFECPYLTSGKSSGHGSRSSAIQEAIQEFLLVNRNQFSDEQKLELLNYIQ